MPQQFTQEQIEKLKELGIEVKSPSLSREGSGVGSVQPESLPVKGDVDLSTEGFKQPTIEIEPTEPETLLSIPSNEPLKLNSSIFPLLSISGLTLLSFGGLVLLKGSATQNDLSSQNTSVKNNPAVQEPTQVPKSIQHYLLTSQQYFSQAISQQSSCTGDSCGRPTIELLNNSILAATEAIKEFPDDYRGYQQRGVIYQALIESKPELIDQSISDFATAFKLNSNSAEITRSLASLYAKKGDANKTIAYLNQTVALEPTKAQNFYDLAKIQQQAGLLSQALDTYNKLTTLVTDPAQKTQVESEKSALEKLIAQNPNSAGPSSSVVDNLPSIAPSNLDSPTIQAMADGGLIIAAPEEDKSITVTNQTDSNSLSGNTTLSSGQKEITISNNNVSSTSQVYVTITKGGKNENLQVLSKSDKSFIIGLDSPISEDIEFKWWIIN